MTLNRIFKKDPTRTLTLRNRFAQEMAKRFKKLKQLIHQSIVDNDCFGLNIQYEQRTINLPIIQFKTNAAIPDQQFAFLRDPQKVPAFMQWLQEMDDDIILEILPGQQLGEAVETAWTNTYIQTAYQKGMLRGRQEVKGNSITGYEDIPPYGSEYGSLQKAFNSPFHADKVGLIYTRAYDGLKGITNEMNKQISSVLAQGISEGFGPKDIAKRIVDRVNKIGITRATILARTEIIRAHHVAMIQEYRNWGVVGVLVQAEWTTAGDSRVCPKCSKLQGRIYTLEEIEPLIPLHPQCRCLALPVDVTDGVIPNPGVIKKKKLVEMPKFIMPNKQDISASNFDKIELDFTEFTKKQIYNFQKKQLADGTISYFERDVLAAKKLSEKRLQEGIAKLSEKDISDYNQFCNFFNITLSTKVGRSLEAQLIANWARTSADTDKLALFLQEMAKKEFNLVSAKSEHLALDMVPGVLLKESNTAALEIQNGARKFLRVMYETTQEQLKKEGITELLLFRGSKHSLEELPNLFNGGATIISDVGKTGLQPMSSFSADISTAKVFSTPYQTQFGNIMAVKVPAERVLSTPISGLGCLHEDEFVILGGVEDTINMYYVSEVRLEGSGGVEKVLDAFKEVFNK